MNELKRQENQINEQIKILDGFEHPGISEELAGTIARSMAREYRRNTIFRYLFRVGVPMAVAAGLVLTAWISLSSRSLCISKPNGTETASVWSIFSGSQETEMDRLFADLDFSTAATQPAATQATDETTEEMDQYLMDIVNKS
jgi:hypothetical protein